MEGTVVAPVATEVELLLGAAWRRIYALQPEVFCMREDNIGSTINGVCVGERVVLQVVSACDCLDLSFG